MKKNCKPIFFLLTNFILVFNLLTFWSIRSMWSGIISITAKPVPYILCVILAITALLTTILNMYKKYPCAVAIWGTLLNILFLILNGYMIYVTLDSLRYFFRNYVLGCTFIDIIAFLLRFTINKITVPMSALDSASSYTIYTRAMVLRGSWRRNTYWK